MSVAQVRSVISDLSQFERSTATGDGSTTKFSLPNEPLVSSALVVTAAGNVQTEITDYTVNLALGLVIFTNAPANAAAIVFEYEHTLIADGDIDTFLTLQDSDVRLASAMALDAIASQRALIEKRIKILGLELDGTAVAKSLREHAQALRAEAASGFDIAEMVTGPLGRRKRIEQQAEKSA